MESITTVSSSAQLLDATGHVTSCGSTYKCSELQLFGKRCAKVISLFYNPSNKLFYEATAGNINRASSGSPPIGPFIFIQNTKLGFYIENQNIGGDQPAIIEYFRDSYEGWYINKYIHGHRHMMTNSESVKFCQCRPALEFNTRSFQLALATAARTMSGAPFANINLKVGTVQQAPRRK